MLVRQLALFIVLLSFLHASVTGFSIATHHRPRLWPPLKVDTLNQVADEVLAVEQLTSTAIEYAVPEQGLKALRELGHRCRRRLPYDFGQPRQRMPGSVVERVPGLFPPSVTEQVFAQVRAMVDKGWLSTNPDSVDGLPSFHLNLISSGKPLAQEDSGDDFSKGIYQLTELVRPYLYDVLLPKVQELMNTTSIAIGDVFLRRYGQDVMGGQSRMGISAHYDVYSQATSVIALDDTAVEGTNGLYTTETSNKGGPAGRTSNHAALRRFFPLECGDAVIHTWDILHGVDVEQGLDRTSLIVWFTSDEDGSTVSPWLSRRPDLQDNDVAQFVLASATESLSEERFESSIKSIAKSSPSEAMYITQPREAQLGSMHPHELYLESAKRGNAFALTRVGSLCEEGVLDERLLSRAKAILEALPSWGKLNGLVAKTHCEPGLALSRQFWLEGAIRGNPLAQVALGDEIMMDESNHADAEARVLAATLFGLAAQQGNEQAAELLARVVAFDVASRGVETEDEFAASPVVQVAMAVDDE